MYIDVYFIVNELNLGGVVVDVFWNFKYFIYVFRDDVLGFVKMFM